MEELSGEVLINAIEVDSHSEYSEELLKSVNSNITDSKTAEEQKLRQKLRFYYMNPIEKWKYKQRFPYKFIVQLIKVIVVTLQSCLFAYHRTFYVDFVFNNKIALSNLFLLGWDPSSETLYYPPHSEGLAIYKKSDFYAAIDFAVKNYVNLDNAVGPYSFFDDNNMMSPLEVCIYHYKVCDLFGFNTSYTFNSDIIKKCIKINANDIADNFSSEQFFNKNKFRFNFSSIVQAKLCFDVKTVNLKPLGPMALPGCYRFNLSVIFDNKGHNGKIRLYLDTTIYRLYCKGSTTYKNDTQMESVLLSLLNSVVIIFCLISLILCSRALYRAQLLRLNTVSFLQKYYNKNLSFKDQLEFLNMWYVTMITSDLFVIIGSSIKERIEKNEFFGDEWNSCCVILGTGTFLIWFCILRYLGFFKTYNVVVLTLKLAAPVILRFMVCTLIIYVGFVFCGWVVLGPYHKKFRTLAITAECLFALINGDDVFETFTTLEPTKSSLIWWFSRIYLYLFISIFIYVILSLFVSIILDAHETIKRYYSEGFPKNDIEDFIKGDLDIKFLNESSSSLADSCSHCCPSSEGIGKIISSICSCTIIKNRQNDSVPYS